MGAFINNARWDDVPFLLKAGKALHSKRAEIRVQFRHVPGNLYRDKLGIDLDRSTNELVWITDFSARIVLIEGSNLFPSNLLYLAQLVAELL